MLNVTVVQPPYFAGEKPDKTIAEFLLTKLSEVEEGALILLPAGCGKILLLHER